MIVFILILILIAILYSTKQGRDFLDVVISILALPFIIIGSIFKTKPEAKSEKKINIKNEDEKTLEKDNDKSIVVTCGSCDKHSRHNRNQGEIIITCTSCSRASKIRT